MNSKNIWIVIEKIDFQEADNKNKKIVGVVNVENIYFYWEVSNFKKVRHG